MLGEYLRDPALRDVLYTTVLTGVAFALMASVLSVFVVLKRLSFIGQGISHAAFGGMGVAAVVGVAGATSPLASAAQFAIVLAFCIAAAFGIARLSDRRSTSTDTAIGIVLVASMAMGAILLHFAVMHPRPPEQVAAPDGTMYAVYRTAPSWESVLFGSLLAVGWSDVAMAFTVAFVILASLWCARRPLLFWAFDEPAAPAFGVPAASMKVLLLILLCLAIVAAMKLAGVILATAILVLPGATALALSERIDRVMALSVAAGLLGVVGGLFLSFQLGWPPGASIVAALTTLFAVAHLSGSVRPRLA